MDELDNNRSTTRKQKGFAGQKMIVLPQKVIASIQKNPLFRALFITHIGYFPKANSHYRERKESIDQHILIYCVEGKGWYEIRNRRYDVQPDDFFILPAGFPHRYSADPDSPWSIYWVHFAGSVAEKFTNSFKTHNKTVHYTISHISDRLHIFEEIYQALERGYSVDNLGYANTSLWHFLGSFCFSDAYRYLKSEEERDPIETSILFMKEHLHENLALEDLAGSAHYSVSYYSSLFKEKTGYSPVDYFIHLKIQKACQYLDLTTLNINEIAQKTGYRDTHYFSRLFRKIMGASPTKYRKNQKG